MMHGGGSGSNDLHPADIDGDGDGLEEFRAYRPAARRTGSGASAHAAGSPGPGRPVLTLPGGHEAVRSKSGLAMIINPAGGYNMPPAPATAGALSGPGPVPGEIPGGPPVNAKHPRRGQSGGSWRIPVAEPNPESSSAGSGATPAHAGAPGPPARRTGSGRPVLTLQGGHQAVRSKSGLAMIVNPESVRMPPAPATHPAAASRLTRGNQHGGSWRIPFADESAL